MSARDDLHEAICGDGCGIRRRCERTDRLIDAYAHELAEMQRNTNPDRSPDWSDGVDWAADLIDPEVSS